MKISVCITVLNEEKNISSLLESLVNQGRRPSEVVLIDGGSVDKTVEIIKHFAKKHSFIRLFEEKCTRSKGRNLSVELARNEIIAMTDAGCFPQKRWLEEITMPFEKTGAEIVAGFYKMVFKNSFQKACSFFLGTLPSRFDVNFLPSARSMAFRKSVWERVGGFSEKLNGAAEDTVFNSEVLENNINITRVKTAVVEWGMPGSLKEFFQKIFLYAKGDASSKIWLFPQKGITSHNIKATFVVMRYLLGLLLLVLTISKVLPSFVLVFIILVYVLYVFRKLYLAFGEIETVLIGILLQFVCDLAVISGFFSGILLR